MWARVVSLPPLLFQMLTKAWITDTPATLVPVLLLIHFCVPAVLFEKNNEQEEEQAHHELDCWAQFISANQVRAQFLKNRSWTKCFMIESCFCWQPH